MNTYAKDYGNYIRERRLKMGLTQEEVAKKLGIHQVAYGRYELGAREPNFGLVIKIAQVLKFDPGDFFNGYIGEENVNKDT